ncbi:glycosyltransferase family 2 protein [Azospirillum rugosum]|uniref:Glycosyltransferase involved in cell wall biosynthesis n=1 Tax=Azospirillum rugosum TaxID=416170 RepID=A0ABS4SHD2_9PROT|nr:glycosyltransferase [Azospirillum rugosum]MBP2291443.1 glycosyltransferase involved in cell wall biosynthesis [Azospirillum rugosum]MDQ0525231.1 glycosyltransferase involved in cell wall biosynthesis [Azospirillum rugosum]
MTNIDFSVIVPCYNAESFVEEALRSALGQSHVSVEVIVIDDASKDRTADIVSEWSSRDSRVKLIVNEKNVGPSASRNAGLRHARGDWVALLDADDVMAPSRLHTLKKIADASNADMIADNLTIVAFPHGTEKTSAFKFLDPHTEIDIGIDDLIRHSAIRGDGLSIGYAKPIIRRNFIASTAVRYKEDIRIAEDFVFYFECLLHGAKFRLISEEFGYIYRRRESSLTKSGGWTLQCLLDINEYLIRKHGDHLTGECKTLLRQRHKKIESDFCYYHFTAAAKIGDFTGAWRYFRKSPESAWSIGGRLYASLERALRIRAK